MADTGKNETLPRPVWLAMFAIVAVLALAAMGNWTDVPGVAYWGVIGLGSGAAADDFYRAVTGRKD